MGYPVVISIAGSDNSGGAGIQADIKAACAFRTYMATVLTCVTAQNCDGLSGILYVGDDMLSEQLHKTFAQFPIPGAVKTGLMPNCGAIAMTAAFLKERNVRNVVVDPILSITAGGNKAGDANAVAAAYREHLMPIATLLTPNLPELYALAGLPPADGGSIPMDEIFGICRDMQRMYDAGAILVKGGHSRGAGVCDYLVTPDECAAFGHERIDSIHTHGTGCALSSAIACCLANDYGSTESIDRAITFVQEAIRLGAENPVCPKYGPLGYFR
ncbi:MAG: hydroxymethylpyrimidine/phosphomethylpyrimidine kinase [Candidatus Amulumruptor caecigallinarius]|nr:hydroxymethylpyrimidine/phosphomethylpyrimidine kinase [Candidatus Amulumruptor caecigallinarius]